MALSRLLLLCMVASEVWDAETKPIEFVCNKGARRTMNIVAGMESVLSSCNGSTTLSTPVQLPCTELHVASWGKKSHQEKRGDIVASLRSLIEGVKAVRALSQPRCATLLLQRLENNIYNYLLILTHLQLSMSVDLQKSKLTGLHLSASLTEPSKNHQSVDEHSHEQGPVVSPALSCVPGSTRSLSTVLLNYKQLISGKLERFMVDLEDTCTSQ